MRRTQASDTVEAMDDNLKDRFDTERTNVRKRCSQGGRHTDTLTVAPRRTLFTFYHVPFVPCRGADATNDIFRVVLLRCSLGA